MSRRGKGVCPVCRRLLTISVGGFVLRHKHRTEKTWCRGQGQEALPPGHGFEILEEDDRG